MWLASAAWLGCNALLDIEGAELAPPSADASADGSTGERDGGADATSPDAANDAAENPCVDTDTNPRHCGACGHDCLGGVCSAGRCQPVTVSSEPGRPGVITIDGEWVYWTNPAVGDIRRARTDGGGVETVYDGPPDTPYGTRIVRSGSDVYFSVDDADGGVFRCAATGCGSAPTPVLAGLANPKSFDLAGTSLVVAESIFDGRVRRCTLPCTDTVTDISTTEGFASYVTVSGDKVAWDSLLPGPGNVRVAEGTSPATTVRSNVVGREIQIVGSMLVFAELGGGVSTVLVDGGAPRRLSNLATQLEHLEVEDARVYFGDSLNGKILRCALSDALPDAGAVLADKQSSPFDVAVDAKQIYWTNRGPADTQGQGSVVRLAK